MSYIFSLSDALLSLRPGEQWTLYGNDYQKLIWHDVTIPPTLEELQTEMTRLQTDYDAKEYQRQRARAYPPLEDLADAIYWQTQGNTEPMNAYIAACAQVKQQYPRG